MLKKTIRDSSIATLLGLAPHYLSFYLFGTGLLTESIAEWIMKNTPSAAALWILSNLGAWAKPFAMTGGLFTLGLCLWVPALLSYWRNRKYERFFILVVLAIPAVVVIQRFFEFHSLGGSLSFWIPALLALMVVGKPSLELMDEDWGEASEYAMQFVGRGKPRRDFLASIGVTALPVVMGGGVVGVAIESYLRELMAANRATEPVPLFSFDQPKENPRFPRGLVRSWLTQVGDFYRMSKNAVDPAIDPRGWRLEVTADGKRLGSFSYAELMRLPRQERFVTLRCISNTLNSDLMGNAAWSGIQLSQLIARDRVPTNAIAVAFEGVDGHGDSLSIDYAFSDETLLALGMNGNTLDRRHGFPIRVLCPRYFGFKHIKWLKEIRFVTQPYVGTYQKMGYEREAPVHTMCSIDNVTREAGRLLCGGIAFAGSRGIQRVQVRLGEAEWVDAELETGLSALSWVRYRAELADLADAATLQARAQDGAGAWQSETIVPMFPAGVAGPTIRKLKG
ncbi:MAG: molybdopterin-dependent oxidoreductase [Bryobacterales bacterium]|jgi:DMSO/TMAO reductase YedYZ molybdopterin-dependent catalytic subunit|nr:molybdopterin-dependent oxidoreductase [Bryobacterales bacterium]